jgi:hypothetical protein
MKTKRSLLLGSVAACLVAGLCASVLNIPAKDVPTKDGIKLPLIVYEEKGSTNNHYFPTGWMGNAKGIKMDQGCTNNPHGGKTCLRFEYSDSGDWGGIVWQDPVNDWGDKPGGWNLTGATNLTFWARGESGDETVTFKFGILGVDKKFGDSSGGELDVKLTKAWKEYTIDLSGKDLTRIKTGFVWSLPGQGQPIIFYLDDIRFE